MKILTWKKLNFLDLFWISVWGLFVWNAYGMDVVLPITFVLLRFCASLGLIQREKSSWLPIFLFVTATLLMFVFPSSLSRLILMDSTFEMVKVFLLLLGDSGMDVITHYEYLLSNDSLRVEKVFFTIFLCCFWGWILFYPIISYIRLWRNKNFETFSFRDGLVLRCIGVLVLSLIVSNIFSISVESSVMSKMNIWILTFSCLCCSFFLSYKKYVSAVVKQSVVYLFIFFGAYLVGRETEHLLSLFGLVTVLLTFYYHSCVVIHKGMSKKETVLIIMSGILFWESQFTYNVLRLILLLLSLAMIAYVTYIFYQQYSSKFKVLGVMFSMGILLPILSIGYNPYSVLHAKRVCKFDAYDYAYNGILRVSDGKHCGLRDRYTEILPCEYDGLFLAGKSQTPYIKVLKDNRWGLYDMESQQVLLAPQYQTIYFYDNYFFRLTDSIGKVSYYQLPGYQSQREPVIVDVPCVDFLWEDIEPNDLSLKYKTMDNAPVYRKILDYILGSFANIQDNEVTADIYLDWAKKCTRMIERMGNEYFVFTLDATSKPQQAINRIEEMLDITVQGTQSYMNSLGWVRAVTHLYLSVERNRDLLSSFEGSPQVQKRMKAEMQAWLHYCWSVYQFCTSKTLAEEDCAARSLDENAVLFRAVDQRLDIVNSEEYVLRNNMSIGFDDKEISVDDLLTGFNVMKKNLDTHRVDSLTTSLKRWMEIRDKLCKELPLDVGISYENVNKKIRLTEWKNLQSLLEVYRKSANK